MDDGGRSGDGWSQGAGSWSGGRGLERYSVRQRRGVVGENGVVGTCLVQSQVQVILITLYILLRNKGVQFCARVRVLAGITSIYKYTQSYNINNDSHLSVVGLARGNWQSYRESNLTGTEQ